MTLDPRLTDTHLLALTLFGEVRSASLEEIVALGCLIRNNVSLGDSYTDVCLRYPCWTESERPRPEGLRLESNHQRLLDVMRALLDSTVDDPQYHECSWVAVGITGGYCRDVLKGATRSHPATEMPRPEWSRELIPVLTYARKTFYAPEASA